MIRISSLLIFLLAVHTPLCAAAEGGDLMHMEANLSNKASLRRGARTFVNYCLSCHSAEYMRFSRMGRDLGISDNVLRKNFMFGTDKVGSTMTVAMRSADAKQFFGVAPPDLSVIARARGGPDWLYTYLMSFYRDPSKSTGVNNLLFKDVSMPDVLWELQGWQRPVYKEVKDEAGKTVKRIDHLEMETPPGNKPKAYQGEDFKQTVHDLVNFLVYVGEPIKLKRYTIGGWIMLYLALLLIVVYLMKREYWKDVH